MNPTFVHRYNKYLMLLPPRRETELVHCQPWPVYTPAGVNCSLPFVCRNQNTVCGFAPACRPNIIPYLNVSVPGPWRLFLKWSLLSVFPPQGKVIFFCTKTLSWSKCRLGSEGTKVLEREGVFLRKFERVYGPPFPSTLPHLPTRL